MSQVVEESPVRIQGLCVGSPKGQMIAYQVIEIGDLPQVIYEGQVECLMGGFELTLNELNFPLCTTRLHVRAIRVGDNVNYTETVLQPGC